MTGDNPRSFWGQKTFCLVTGASQGIGRQLALEFASRFSAGSVLVLLARSEAGLQKTQQLVEDVNPSVQVVINPIDLSKGSAVIYKQIIQDALNKFDAEPRQFQLAFMVHNAGSVGSVGQMAENMDNEQEWDEYLSLNFTSTSVLNSVFLKVFPLECGASRTIINITSLCAVQPFRSMGQYCVGKAAREMFFKVLAEENPSLDVLSYSPGPVDTDMTTEIINHTADSEIRKAFVDMREKKTIVTCEQTSKKLAEILVNKKYKSGQRVDYFDEGF